MTTDAPYPSDRSALRVLAHPLRSRLVAELRSVGAATATDLARVLGTNSGATSYHLRKLEEVGLVRDTGGVGRRRVWEAATEGRTFDVGDTEDDDAALDWLARDYIGHFTEKAQTWLTDSPSGPCPGRRPAAWTTTWSSSPTSNWPRCAWRWPNSSSGTDASAPATPRPNA
ncbi:ArsR/SmtB family transcription factor [Mobilicoccus caccae]|uniref:HTH arsR-type domain-containing protein n=1 Tax=Mobilicoccus caccae TaxID=1859295 RepID=A0ABQ6IS62_9MICO|nr:hypothetical protein GCM10025883_25710 [Mobilicoccus caccae]